MRAKKSRDYGLAEAKAYLSEVVARAEREGPQRILVRGRPAAMVVSAKDWEQHRQPAGSFLDWLKSTGVYGIGVELEEPPKHFSEPPDFTRGSRRLYRGQRRQKSPRNSEGRTTPRQEKRRGPGRLGLTGVPGRPSVSGERRSASFTPGAAGRGPAPVNDKP